MMVNVKKFDALTRSLPLKYVLMALLPMAVLLYTPISNFAVLHFGEKILLATRPVDPRDILRGDYVMLSYEIENISEEMVSEELAELAKSSPSGRLFDVYVSLRLDGDGIASAAGVSLRPPADGIYLKAIFPAWAWSTPDVNYNLGVYYIPEGTGRELEKAIEAGSVLADVRVLRGRGVIRNLEITETEE